MKCCDMTAGMLREPIQLQRKTSTPDGGGGVTVTWATYATVRAMFKPLSGSERVASDRVEALTKNKATIRYRDGVLESDRVVARGEAYNIRAALNLEFRDKWLELHLAGGEAT